MTVGVMLRKILNPTYKLLAVWNSHLVNYLAFDIMSAVSRKFVHLRIVLDFAR